MHMQQLNSTDQGGIGEANAESTSRIKHFLLGQTGSVNSDKTGNLERAGSQSRQACALWQEEN